MLLPDIDEVSVRSAMASTEKCAMGHRGGNGGMQVLLPTVSGIKGKSLNLLLVRERGRDFLFHRTVGSTADSCKVLG